MPIEKPERRFYVYLMSSSSQRALYIGVTNNLIKRVAQHRRGDVDGYSSRYKTHRLVYFESFRYIKNAIIREKEIKGWLRRRKDELVESKNPLWEDLSSHWY